jgi:hypothetical protein
MGSRPQTGWYTLEVDQKDNGFSCSRGNMVTKIRIKRGHQPTIHSLQRLVAVCHNFFRPEHEPIPGGATHTLELASRYNLYMSSTNLWFFFQTSPGTRPEGVRGVLCW